MKKTVFISLVIGFLAAALLMGAVLNGWLDLPVISAPANPSSGFLRIFANTSTGKLDCKDSGGNSCLASGSGWNASLSSFTPEVNANMTVADNLGSISYYSTAPDGVARYRSNTAFTAGSSSVAASAEFFMTRGSGSANPALGIWIKNNSCGGSNPGYIALLYIWLQTSNQGVYYAAKYDCNFNNTGDVISPTAVGGGQTLSLRIREASGTRYYELSADALARGPWVTLFSEPTNTYITPTAAGFHAGGGLSSGRVTTWAQQ